MSEGAHSNIESTGQLNEQKGRARIDTEIIEIIEAIVLALVAVATAWSGYQAVLWTGHQTELYGKATKVRMDAERTKIAANQERLYNAVTVAQWITAEGHGDKKLAGIFERRLLPEFRPAFEAWKKTDPLNNADAPAGPHIAQEEYSTPRMDEAIRLDKESEDVFEQGNAARGHSDSYVRVTVTLATVLLLTAISQRFKIRNVRIGLAMIAMLLLCSTIYRIATLPRV